MPVTDDDEYDGPVSMAATQSTTSKAEQRKSNKPIMEKRRRARINHCLNELKTLILNAMKKDPARHSKLEKADILEMTVKHLQGIQRQQLAAAVSADPTVISRFRNGFDECASEVSRYISRLEGVDTGVKQRLSAHLHRCVSSLQQMTPPNHSAAHDDNNNSSQRAVLIPSRLPTGEIALVLPNYNSFLAGTPNSAFTAIKPSNEGPRHFQPFKVEIPNSHLTAHISLPDGFDTKNPGPPASPKQHHLPQISENVSSTESYDRLHPKQSLPEIEIFKRARVIAPEKRSDVNRVSVYKTPSKPEATERLQPSLVHQKPNPNFVLHPKLRTSPQKMLRYGELGHGRQSDLEPPIKVARFAAISPPTPPLGPPRPPSGPPRPPSRPPSAPRSSVIVTDTPDAQPPGGVSGTGQPQQRAEPTPRDNMWRPW